MNYTDIPLLSLMKQKMNYLSARQGVLAQNIANADTPGFRAQDIKAPDFSAMVQQAGGMMPLARTDGKHLPGGNANGSAFTPTARAVTFETNPNGNTVTLEEEVQKMAMNQMDYNQTLALYRKTADMFKTAIGRSGG